MDSFRLPLGNLVAQLVVSFVLFGYLMVYGGSSVSLSLVSARHESLGGPFQFHFYVLAFSL